MSDSQLLEQAKKIVLRHHAEKTIYMLAKSSGLSRSYLQHFAAGKIKTPGVSQVEAILRASGHRIVLETGAAIE